MTQIESDMIVILKAFKTTIDDSEKINNELIRLRSRYEELKLRIDSLENKLLIPKDGCVILSYKYTLSISEQNFLVVDNIRLIIAIEKLQNSIDLVESHERMTHNFLQPLSKSPGISLAFPKLVATPLKDLQNLTHMGDILNHTYSNTPFSPL